MNRSSSTGCIAVLVLAGLVIICGLVLASSAVGDVFDAVSRGMATSSVARTPRVAGTALREPTAIAQVPKAATLALKASVTPRVTRTPRPSRTPVPTRTPRPSRTPTPTNVPGKPVELAEAVAQKLIAVSIVGNGLETINITIQSKATEPLDVQVLPGTIFRPAQAATQNMVVRFQRVIYVEPGAEVKRSLQVACANMHKSGPSNDDTFTILSAKASPDLLKLMALPEFSKQPFRVQQFAIWTITDNPARTRYVGLGAMGVGRGPTDEQMATIKELFIAAGIDTSKYQALR